MKTFLRNDAIRFVLCLSALFLAACETVPTGPQSGFSPVAANGNLVTRVTRFSFPPEIGAFKRIGGHQYDAAGLDVSVKYEAGRLIVLDVYDYPAKNGSLQNELRFREGEIKQTHADARLISETPITIHPGGQSHTGQKAVFEFTQNFRPDVKGPYKSQLLVFPVRDRFVAYRATFSRDHADRAERELDQFLNALAWPNE